MSFFALCVLAEKERSVYYSHHCTLGSLGLYNMIHSYIMVYPDEFEDFDLKADTYKINKAERLNSNI